MTNKQKAIKQIDALILLQNTFAVNIIYSVLSHILKTKQVSWHYILNQHSKLLYKKKSAMRGHTCTMENYPRCTRVHSTFLPSTKYSHLFVQITNTHFHPILPTPFHNGIIESHTHTHIHTIHDAPHLPPRVSQLNYPPGIPIPLPPLQNNF
jgi:hypothetical protein